MRGKRVVRIGPVEIGEGRPIEVQTMLRTRTENVEEAVRVIEKLRRMGCRIVRVAIPNERSAEALLQIKRRTENLGVGIVADVHFSGKLALLAMKKGADKVRINPGNFPQDELESLVRLAKKLHIPIRVGANSGSLPKDILERYKHPTAEAIVEAVERQVQALQKFGFDDIVLSAKSSDVNTTISAYEILFERFPYPLHVGITEAGPLRTGTVKSAIAIGILLHRGIGDTIRVSLTASPADEVIVGKAILRSLGLEKGPDLISCPMCGRGQVDIRKIAEAVEELLYGGVGSPIRVAVMGCVVNGPGEAREADIALVGGAKVFLVYKRGKLIGKVGEDEAIRRLAEEVAKADRACEVSSASRKRT